MTTMDEDRIIKTLETWAKEGNDTAQRLLNNILIAEGRISYMYHLSQAHEYIEKANGNRYLPKMETK